MSLQSMSWVINQDVTAADGKFVLLMLANHADEDGYCWPSVKKLSAECGMAERTVKTHLARLVELGYISRERRHRKNGSRTSDGYQLLFERQGADSAPCTQDDSKVQIRPTLGANSAPPEPSYNPQVEIDTPTVVSISSGDEKKQATKRKPRKRNPTWDAVAAVCGEPGGKTEASDFGKTVSELQDIDATPEEIADFPRWWRQAFKGATLTHRCYRSHFGKYRNDRDRPPDISELRDPFIRALIQQGVSSNGRGTNDTHSQARRIGQHVTEAQSLGPGITSDG